MNNTPDCDIRGGVGECEGRDLYNSIVYDAYIIIYHGPPREILSTFIFSDTFARYIAK